MSDSADIAIIGAGAAGLASAIFAAQSIPSPQRIVLLDGAKTIGAKILVSGGGRCNVTHDVVTRRDYNGPQNIIRNILRAFDAAQTVRWFDSLGVALKREETGKLFPVTDSARTVLGALIDRCEALGVIVAPQRRVTAIRAPQSNDPRFVVDCAGQSVRAARVIICAGGRSLPRSGSDGSGWELARRLGHSVTPTFAALVPLVLQPQMFHASVAGISHDVELSTFNAGRLIDRRAGSLLWTHFGISGPVVMDASRFWIIAKETGGNPELRGNFLHPDGFEQAERWLIEQASRHPRASLGGIFSERLPERLADAIVEYIQLDPALPLAQLARENRRRLVHAMTELALPVQQHRGWNYAEVTAGGVPLDEIDFRTMRSRKVPGLYLAGEILDCDGRIGGFNFQWAWSTGYIAGTAAARSLERRPDLLSKGSQGHGNNFAG